MKVELLFLEIFCASVLYINRKNIFVSFFTNKDRGKVVYIWTPNPTLDGSHLIALEYRILML